MKNTIMIRNGVPAISQGNLDSNGGLLKEIDTARNTTFPDIKPNWQVEVKKHDNSPSQPISDNSGRRAGGSSDNFDIFVGIMAGLSGTTAVGYAVGKCVSLIRSCRENTVASEETNTNSTDDNREIESGPQAIASAPRGLFLENPSQVVIQQA